MKPEKKPDYTVEFMIFLALLTIVIVYKVVSLKKELPVLNPTDLNPQLVARSLQHVDDHHTVADFSLINQNGETVTAEDYRDKIYVADFFFTRCPSICPLMTDNMEKLQQVFLRDSIVRLLSISVTPEMDSIPVLRNYADKNGIVDTKWNITTGDKEHIYDLARKSFFAVSDFSDGALQDFIHSPNFVLVDTRKQIRGIYDGTKDEEIERLIQDIRLLLD